MSFMALIHNQLRAFLKEIQNRTKDLKEIHQNSFQLRLFPYLQL